jgi:hypothetical protein
VMLDDDPLLRHRALAQFLAVDRPMSIGARC